ncbi:MAG: phytanoyl-CoA dioxygenase family protein, partial [Acidimicrobiaceae bacterium]|nr:phytanoyl-CoA dioxygenase family protein [Acidimicrobiaceae bacterium]MYI53104.1 phytanoyl-CoA dioxygenase family protein [Acidimicrobiaceae bacterium]MYJ80222.1 phytanoyl-CoA dioxygenase family protein [Acidimicrobiaceae bacterium]
MNAPLTPGQVEAYRSDGYVVVRNALPHRSVVRLRDAADAFAEQALRLSGDTDVIELEDAAAFNGAPARVRRIKSPHLHHETFAAALAHPPLLDMVEALIGADIRWHHTKSERGLIGGQSRRRVVIP